MDFDKLPKLSQTSTPSNDPGERGRDRAIPHADGREGELAFFDIFVAVGLGLFFIFMGMDYAKYNYARMTGGAWSTGVVWPTGHPKANQPVTVDELEEPFKSAHSINILSQGSLFVLGAMMALGGVAGFFCRLGLIPLSLRLSASVLGILLVAGGMLYALWATVTLMRGGTTPAMTLVAILTGGLSLFMHVEAARYLLAIRKPSPARNRVLGVNAGPGPTTLGKPEPKARAVHSRFAHQALRQQAFEQPARCLGMLQGPSGRKFLLDVWETVRQSAGADGTEAGSEGLESEMTQVGPYSAAIVTLPRPAARGEAYFVGLVLRSYTREDGAVIERDPLLLYYTLEADGLKLDGTPTGSSLCEWQAGDHVKFRDAVAPEFNAFREAMRQQVMARQKREDEGAGLKAEV